MALSIENPEVERLAAEVAELAGESETEAVRRALQDRKEKLQSNGHAVKRRNVQESLEKHVWPFIPREKLGKPITREEEDEILGYGPNGYCE